MRPGEAFDSPIPESWNDIGAIGRYSLPAMQGRRGNCNCQADQGVENGADVHVESMGLKRGQLQYHVVDLGADAQPRQNYTICCCREHNLFIHRGLVDWKFPSRPPAASLALA